MAKSRRNYRKSSRKSHRKSHRKTHRKNATRRGGSRRSRSSRGFFTKVYSPVSHLLQATGEAVGAVTGTVDTVAKTGIRGIDSIGKSVTGHANMAVRNLVSRKRRSHRK